MKLPTDNIVFLDTEFSSLDPYKGEILSIALVKSDGEELYLELEYDGGCDPWVADNILPTLTAQKVSRADAKDRIVAFAGPDKPRVIAFVNQFDTLYLHKLLGGVDENPFFWIPVDFAAVLFGLGHDPEKYYLQDLDFFRSIGIDPTTYKQHHALDDVRLLRDTYFALK